MGNLADVAIVAAQRQRPVSKGGTGWRSGTNRGSLFSDNWAAADGSKSKIGRYSTERLLGRNAGKPLGEGNEQVSV